MKKTQESFPYLDMKISWSESEKLPFCTYLTPGQAIKYMKKGSSHQRSCLIRSSILKRLGKVTSKDEKTKHQAVNKIYPDHIKALEKANLLLAPDFKKLPKMKDLWRRNAKDQRMRSEKNREKENDRSSIYYVQGYSSLFSKLPEPLHRTINKVFKANHIPWLHTRMAYKKFCNLGELLQSDLSSKLNENLTSLDYMDRPCNCPTHCKLNGKCPFNDKCRTSCIVYQVRCKSTGKIYIGNTQQYFKIRIGAHLSYVKRLALKGKKNSFFCKPF